MNKIINILVLIVVPFFLFGQTTLRGKVVDSDSKEALAFANIVLSATNGTITDAEGVFNIPLIAGATNIRVSYIGYETLEVPIQANKSFYTIELKPLSASLTTVVVKSDFENPAITLMRRVVKKKDENDYRKKVDKYSFIKYYKFLVTAEPDSIDVGLDSLYKDGELVRVDSAMLKFRKELKDKDIFVMESVMKVNGKNGQEKNKVIASRTAGFKNPMYEILAIQVGSHNVYDDYYKIMTSEYLGPVTLLSLKQYIYQLEEEITIQGRKVEVVSYKNTTRPLISGQIFIDQKSLAIAKMTLNTFREIELQTKHHFDYVAEADAWLPREAVMSIKKAKKENNLSLSTNNISVGIIDKNDSLKHTNTAKESDYLYALAKTKFSELNLNDLHEDKIKYNMQVADDAHTKSQDFWSKYRDEDRVEREHNTYVYVDSMVREDNVEKKLNIYRKVMKGYMPVGYFDLDITKMFDANKYEKFRMSLGGRTNEKVSNRFYVAGYLAYGFGDEAFKYSGEFNYKINHISQTRISLKYTDDLMKSASFTDQSYGSLTALNQLSYSKFYNHKTVELGLSHIITKSLMGDIKIKRQAIDVKHFYEIGQHADRIYRGLTSVNLGFEFDPFSSFFLNPSGRDYLKSNYPKFYFNIEKSIPQLQDWGYNYYRLEFQTDYQKTYLNGHSTMALFKLGFANKNADLLHLFSPTTNASLGPKDEWFKKINIRVNSKFETMQNLEFADNFVTTFHLGHTFNDLKVTSKFRFDLKLIGRAAYGYSSNRNLYLEAKSLDKGYFEAGVELNRLVKYAGSGLGLGFYYRMGKYAHSDAIDNLAIRLTFTTSKLLKF